MIVAGIAKRITPPVEVILFTSRLPGWGNLSIVRPSTVPEKQGSASLEIRCTTPQGRGYRVETHIHEFLRRESYQD